MSEQTEYRHTDVRPVCSGSEELEALETAVLLCDNLPFGRQLSRWLLGSMPGVVVGTVRDLCHRPQGMGKIVPAGRVSRLVLGLCSPQYAVADVQAQARKAGLDALGVEVVSLQSLDRHVDRARVLIAAAVARARAFAGSRPEQAKMSLATSVSRRSLLSLSLPEYRAVPAITGSRCAADVGCQVCVRTCPQAALTWSDGRIVYDKGKCEPCGLCVTACPRGAIENPAVTPAQLEAQVSTLLHPAIGGMQPRGIVFLCQRAPEPDGPWYAGWMPVRLPCVGMAPPTWLLAPLLMGASAVGVVSCGTGCAVGQDAVVAERVAYCRQFLQAIGAPADRVRLSPALDCPPVGEAHRVAVGRLFDPTATVTVLDALAQQYHAPADLALVHVRSPFGVVEIEAAACTGCGRCAMGCPSQALVFEPQPEGVRLSFDAALCTACGQCVPTCPEAGAIRLAKRTDLGRIRRGRTPIYRAETARCVACGAVIAPDTMLKRIETLLAGEHAASLAVIRRYCMDCRSTGVG